MSAWSDYKKNLGNTRPWDLVTGADRAEDAIAKERLDTCLECPHFFSPTKQCRKCGCVMTAKVKLAAATCPIGKW